MKIVSFAQYETAEEVTSIAPQGYGVDTNPAVILESRLYKFRNTR